MVSSSPATPRGYKTMKRLYLGGGERDARRYSPAGAINTLAHATATHTVLQSHSEDVNILHMQENTVLRLP